MLSSKIFQNLTLPEDAKEYLENLDDYDDPYFMCVKVLKENDQMMKVVNDTLSSYGEELYGIEGFRLEEGLILLSIDAEKEHIQALSTDLKDNLTTHGFLTHIAVFHHNSLGEAMETFKWSTQLLEELLEASPDESAIGINDFSDRGNWPGIEKYMNK